MSGFRNIKEWVQSEDDGKVHYGMFRKFVPRGAITIAGQWFDYSTASSYPVANYYASSPLISAKIESDRGIYVPCVSPERQFIRKIGVMSSAAGVTTATSQNQILILMDYLLYYPFIDLDAVAEEQSLTNSVALDRYTDGNGVMMMLVSQSATAGGGFFTINYTNSDGVAGRVTEVTYCVAAQPSGAIVNAITNASGAHPFVPLASGDKGVRSVQSITMARANGGLAAIVLVKPLMWTYVREECRRPTSSPAEDFGDATEVERIRMQSGTVQIVDGAVLGFIGRTSAGSIASSVLVGTLETVWR
jgi:hypothetical protein